MINQENTYLGADGLAYCKICGEPVEAFFPPDSILGMKKHFRQCACIRQKREVEEKYRNCYLVILVRNNALYGK